MSIYDAPEIDYKEIYRYLGVLGRDSENDIKATVESCIDELSGKLVYKVCFCSFEIFRNGNDIDLGVMKTNSKSLSKNLEGCDSAIIFGATIGIEIDRLISRYSSISPSKALVFQAIGAERIESLCNLFCDDIKGELLKKNKTIRPRFSPGYGDLPLALQRDLFSVLDCPRKIGLTLNESMLMSPTKSVTAIIGIADRK